MSDVPSTSSSLDIKPCIKIMDLSENRVSPPKAIVDSSPLQPAMDRNRESLKVKLLVRRSANQLVEQGILPPLKTSPAIHEQKKLLERAKTGDMLKAKIQQRPNRQELERRHILETHEGHIDPSLADKYRMLEKAILVDQLNKKILHRPGPLELIEKNILHANEPIERIVKEGLVPFKVLPEGSTPEQNFLSFEDDSLSSESEVYQQSSKLQSDLVIDAPGDYSQEKGISFQDKHTFEPLATSSGVINISLVPTSSLLTTPSTPISVATFKIHNQNVETINIPPPPPPPKLELITYHVKPVMQTQLKGIINTQNFLPIQIAEPPSVNTVTPSLVPSQAPNVVNQHVSSFIQNNQKFSAPGKEKNRKKCKNKAASKSRAIKFHEYKGPPNKNNSSMSPSTSSAVSKKAGETNYEVIMQQQCLLEFLEGIYKNPNAVNSKPESESTKFSSKPIKMEKIQDSSIDDRELATEKAKVFSKPHVTIFPSKSPQQPQPLVIEQSKEINITDVSKLSKMKVSELKAHLKKINLPVSGPKPLLIERLKPYLPLKPPEEITDDASTMLSEGNEYYNTSVPSVSSIESEMDSSECMQGSVSSTKEEDIVAEQQRKIEELQRKLQQSQQELEKMKQCKTADVLNQQPESIIAVDPQLNPQYQLVNQLSVPSVYIVDIPESSISLDDSKVETTLSPDQAESPVYQKSTTPVSVHCSTPDLAASLSPTVKQSLMHKKEHQMSFPNQVVKEISSSTSPPTPTSQDITDVLEILLRSGEWPELSGEDKINCNSFLNNPGNDMDAKRFIEGVLSVHSPFNVVSPMNEDPIMQTNDEIDKILDDVTPSNDGSSIVHGNFSNGFDNASNLDFAMEIEEDTPLGHTHFNRGMFQNAESPRNSISYQPNHYEEMKLEHCDNQFVENNENIIVEQPIIKQEFTEHKESSNHTRNGLIGNFDHKLFDTLKYNTINNNNNLGTENFLLSQEKFAKDDNKILCNNLSLSNNFDLFTSIDNTAMDFENIIPYNDLHSESLFQIPGFESALNRGGNFESFNDHNGFGHLNDDSRMSNSDNMNCEVDNLLCNL